MNRLDILHILDDEKAWLEHCPGMQPWDDGCHRLVTLLEDRLRHYSPKVREQGQVELDNDHSLYLSRLWQCLAHHWRDALGLSNGDATAIAAVAQSGDARALVSQVADQIAAGRGYRRGKQLGGDPLRDMVLAVAMTRRDQRATRVFQEDYYAYACALATKVDRALAADPDPWWNDLLDFLAGYTRPTAKLEKFSGGCALKNWLPRVIFRFLYRRCQAKETALDRIDDFQGAASTPLPLESLEHFTQIVSMALGEFTNRERLLLQLIYVDELPKNEAAAVLGVHPGTVSRAVAKALSRLEAAILKTAADRLSEEACVGVFEDLRDNPKLFAARLREALRIGEDPS